MKEDIAAFARVTEPGCKADTALILEDRQGLGKSSALKALAQPWFTDEVADLGTKDAASQDVVNFSYDYDYNWATNTSTMLGQRTSMSSTFPSQPSLNRTLDIRR